MSDGRINNGRFRGTANLGKVGQKCGKVLGQSISQRAEKKKRRTYEETAVQSFPALPFYGIVSSATFSGVGTTVWLALYTAGGWDLGLEIIHGSRGGIVAGVCGGIRDRKTGICIARVYGRLSRRGSV